MRYSLVSFLACPICHGNLATVIVGERPALMSARPRVTSSLVAPEGAIVAPLEPRTQASGVRAILDRYAASPASAGRDGEVEVESGLLVCQACTRWFPVTRLLPELLPDHLRDRERDARIFEECARGLPPDLVGALRRGPTGAESSTADRGASHKRAEIGISAKVDDPHFFSPGY